MGAYLSLLWEFFFPQSSQKNKSESSTDYEKCKNISVEPHKQVYFVAQQEYQGLFDSVIRKLENNLVQKSSTNMRVHMRDNGDYGALKDGIVFYTYRILNRYEERVVREVIEKQQELALRYEYTFYLLAFTTKTNLDFKKFRYLFPNSFVLHIEQDMNGMAVADTERLAVSDYNTITLAEISQLVNQRSGTFCF